MSRKGFSLLELVIVVAVLAILAGLALGIWSTVVDGTRRRLTETRVHSLGCMINEQAVLKGHPPASLGEMGPVMTLDAAADRWITFNLREDRMNGIDIGTKLDLVAEGGRTIPARVTEIRGLGEFATWRAARAIGDHDLTAFVTREHAFWGRKLKELKIEMD